MAKKAGYYYLSTDFKQEGSTNPILQADTLLTVTKVSGAFGDVNQATVNGIVYNIAPELLETEEEHRARKEKEDRLAKTGIGGRRRSKHRRSKRRGTKRTRRHK